MTINAKKITRLGGLLVALFCIFVILLKIDLLFTLRIAAGLFYALFLPGYCISYIFWEKKYLNKIERLLISIVFSITVVALMCFALNKSKIGLSAKNISIEIFVLIIASSIIIKYKKTILKHIIESGLPKKVGKILHALVAITKNKNA